VIVVTIELSGDDAEEAREEIGAALEDLRDMGRVFDFSICTSDDPNDHQGDTCPIHEA
jgi:hypothetical protein